MYLSECRSLDDIVRVRDDVRHTPADTEETQWKVVSAPYGINGPAILFLTEDRGLEGPDWHGTREKMLESVIKLHGMIKRILGDALKENKNRRDTVIVPGVVLRNTLEKDFIQSAELCLFREGVRLLKVREERNPHIRMPVAFTVKDPGSLVWLLTEFPEMLKKWDVARKKTSGIVETVTDVCDRFLNETEEDNG